MTANNPANLTTLQETTRTPIDGTEYVRLATTGANWKATLSNVVTSLATIPSSLSVATLTASQTVTAARFILTGVNAQTGVGYTLAATDNGLVVTLNNASPIALTCPPGLGIAFSCSIIQLGVGQVTVSAGVGATLNSYNGLVSLAGRYAMGTIMAPTANGFILGGQLS